MLKRSHSTQKLANYFDSKLVRTRENPYAIDSQLLNTASVLLDDASLRYGREIKALELPNCPTALDNNGVYYTVNLDNNYSLGSDTVKLNSVSGTKNGVDYNLSVYDDTLPIPAGYNLDPLRSSTKVESPLLTSFYGRTIPILTNIINQTLPITNKLSFWLANTFTPALFVDIIIYGVKYPVSPWLSSSQVADVETIQVTSEGFFETISSWISIDKIVVRNLPVGGELSCYSISFGIPGSLDALRPASTATFRDSTFDKYWQINSDNNFLQESYYLDNLSGLVYYQSYDLSIASNCVAVEPNTWGGLLGGGTNLHYFDRREPMPDLTSTGLSVEPCYGLDVYYDVSVLGNARSVVIRPIPYKNADIVSQYRFIIESPDGNLSILLSNGSTILYGSSVGWQTGIPSTIVFPLVQTGLFRITLQCLDQTGTTTFDMFPYMNFGVNSIIKQSYDLSNLLVDIQSIAYDFLGNLWIWDGLWAIPLKPFYNAYVLDPVGRKMYLTDEWDQVSYS